MILLIALHVFFTGALFATEPTPPTLEQIAEMRRKFVSEYSFDAKRGDDPNDFYLESLLRHDPDGFRVNDEQVLGTSQVKQALTTYPDEVIARYLKKHPWSTEERTYQRARQELRERGYDLSRIPKATPPSAPPLACESDADCVPTKNGCALKIVAGNSPRANHHCECRRGPTVYGCFRK